MDTDPANTPEGARRLPVLAQAVAAPLTRAAIFLVVTINPAPKIEPPCDRSAETSPLVRAVEFRDLEGVFPA